MSKNTAILGIGVIFLLMPFLGFPTTWKNFFDVVFGVSLIALSFSVAIKRRSSVKKSVRRKKEGMNPMFVDAMAVRNTESRNIETSGRRSTDANHTGNLESVLDMRNTSL